MKLVIGNNNDSPWSLRAWLALRVAGLAFEEQRFPLDETDGKTRMLTVLPATR